MEYSSAFVCLMGMGTVFVGLVCIIVLCMLMSKLLGKPADSTATLTRAATPAPAAAGAAALTPETVAAISAAIAEEMGTDLSAIRILSIRKV